MATLTITTTPIQAKVQFTTDSVFLTNGSTISVRPGTIIHYTISCEGYHSINDSIKIIKDTTLGITLVKDSIPDFTFTINPSPLDAKVIFNYAHIKQVMGISLSDIRININQFITKLGNKNVRGTYLFKYVLNSWTYNGKNVVISNYGITYRGTPGDSDELLVTYEKDKIFANNTFTAPQYTSINYSISKDLYYPIPAEGMPKPMIILDNDITLNLILYKVLPENFNITVKPTPEIASVYAYKSGINFKITGNPLITQSTGYLTNFTNIDYYTITVDNNIINDVFNSFEIVFDIEIPAIIPAHGRILSVSKSTSAELGPVIELSNIDNVGVVKLITGSTECAALSEAIIGNRYLVKWTYSDNSISGYYSNDNGETWNLVNTVSATPVISASDYTLGTCESLGSSYSLGNARIYYKNSYIKFNNKFAWHCIEGKSFNIVNVDYEKLIDIFYTVVCDGYTYKYVTSTIYSSITEQVSLVRSSFSPLTIFESSVHGNYEVTIPTSDYYNITLVGAGGGGAFGHRYDYYFHSYYTASGCAGGGSGSRLSGQLFIKAGTYNVTVGTGGQSIANSKSTVTGANGGDTIAFDNIAGGGFGGSVKYNGWIYRQSYKEFGGAGGSGQSINLTIVEGNSGSTSNGSTTYGGASTLEPYELSTSNGKGAGGSGKYQSHTNGIDGYIKIATAE